MAGRGIFLFARQVRKVDFPISISRTGVASEPVRINPSMPAKYSVQQCQRFRLQHAANEAFAVHEQQAKRGLDIDHLGSSPLGYFHLRLSINGRCWLKIGNRQWGAMLRDTSRHVGSTRKNARFMTWAWNKIQPKKPPLRPGFGYTPSAKDGTRAKRHVPPIRRRTRDEDGTGTDAV